MIKAYVLLGGADEGIAQDYNTFREKNRRMLETYVR